MSIFTVLLISFGVVLSIVLFTIAAIFVIADIVTFKQIKEMIQLKKIINHSDVTSWEIDTVTLHNINGESKTGINKITVRHESKAIDIRFTRNKQVLTAVFVYSGWTDSKTRNRFHGDFDLEIEIHSDQTGGIFGGVLFNQLNDLILEKANTYLDAKAL